MSRTPPVSFPIPENGFPNPWQDFRHKQMMDESQLLALLHVVIS